MSKWRIKYERYYCYINYLRHVNFDLFDSENWKEVNKIIFE